MQYPEPIAKLIDSYMRLPGIGEKTAVRLAFFTIDMDEEDVSEFSGVISIYGERWEARSENKTVIPKGSEVRIVRNESIIMYVEKLKEEGEA